MAESISKATLSAVPEGHIKKNSRHSKISEKLQLTDNRTSRSRSAKKRTYTEKIEINKSLNIQNQDLSSNFHAQTKRLRKDSLNTDCIALRTRSRSLNSDTYIEKAQATPTTSASVTLPLVSTSLRGRPRLDRTPNTPTSTSILKRKQKNHNTSRNILQSELKIEETPKTQNKNLKSSSAHLTPQQSTPSTSKRQKNSKKIKETQKALRNKNNIDNKTTTTATTPHNQIIKKLKKDSNLGARLVRSSDGGSSGAEGSSCNIPLGESSSQHYQHNTYAPPSTNLLRRSSRSKRQNQALTTGSCVSNNSQLPTRSSHRNQNKQNLSSTDNQRPSTSSSSELRMASDDRSGINNQGNIEKSKTSASSSSNDGNFGQAQGHASNALLENTPIPNIATPATAASSTNQQDSESDDNEVGRLQALLEARGLPPHLFGALGPRMHHILNRTIGTSSSAKAQNLLVGLQSSDESQQLQSAIEMCQILVMGNEDTLSGFPIKQVVPALIALLRMEHNFDIMNNACRALAYMLEALPRSSLTVVDAIPVFLEKLQVIQCMDVAEQSLTALEILSRRHNKAILQANGVSACLTYLDFFSINAQRAALSITANCCLNLHSEEFHFVKDSLSLLARLLAQQDKKCVESVCTVFTRLVDSFQHDPGKLQEIASMDLLKNCQQLLIVTPSILNSGTFTNVVRMISIMCGNCPDLAITLLKNDIASTLLYLLTGSSDPITNGDVELVSRSPSELYEITCLIGELMPRLPNNGIFVIDAFLDRPQQAMQDQIQWQWRDDRGVWHSYASIDSKMIEAAHLNSDDEISLITLGRTYTIDFHSMQQINEDTGTTRPVQRKINPTQNFGESVSVFDPNQCTDNEIVNALLNYPHNNRDARVAGLKEEHGLAADFIKNLFSVLYEVYSSSAGPAVRYKCLRALLRMVYFANSDILKDILKNQIVSSHIAGMMASNDLRIIVGSLQMAEILMQKLPDVFSVHFRREGVMHQVTQLTDPNNPLCLNHSPKEMTTPPNTSNSVPMATFDFEKFDSATTKSSAVHIKPALASGSSSINNKNTNTTTMPSTSGTSSSMNPLNYPSTSSNVLALKNTFQTESSSNTHNLNNSGLLFNAMYTPQTTASSATESNRSTLSGVHYQFSKESLFNEERCSSPGQSKMSEILKRKVPPKRKSQGSSRVKSRQEETSAPSSGNIAQSSVLQELITTTLGSSVRSTPSTSTSRSRFSSGTSKTSSFLASLNPVRWARSQGSHNTSYSKENVTNFSKTTSNTNFITAGNREKTRQWIRDQAMSFVNRYCDQNNVGLSHPASTILTRLTRVIQKLEGNSVDCLSALRELHDILIESDISPFEVNHSGLIKAMLNFMAGEQGNVPRENRLRLFLHVFVGLPIDYYFTGSLKIKPNSFHAFVTKLNGCVTQLEQFPVKVHDFPAGVGGRSNTSALKFFNTHQLKCNLQRHPDCTNLRQWKGGTVKIDPLALVQAIERYLVVRGYGGIRVDSEEDSEEDIDDTVAAAAMSQSGFKHKLQFMIDCHVLPYNMTVYQAIKQYSPLVNDQSETDTDSETPIGNASIWVQQHTIYYRPIEEDSQAIGSKGVLTGSSKKGKNSFTKIFRRRNEIWADGCVPSIVSPLTKFLSTSLPPDIVMVQDASLDALCMLRIVNALNRYWNTLYYSLTPQLIINQIEFTHSKITAKANRQLQDPLVIMTGNLPQWLQQIAMACPFLFPFETRHLLFYAVSFDRDRALQRLLDSTPDFNAVDTSERVTPRLDKRKRSISRTDILKQAENIIQDYGHSKALLEIQYEDEVGTGLGPTLEFYTLVSTEIQRSDLGLWNESDSYKRSSPYITDVVKTKYDGKESETSRSGNLINDNGISLNMLIEQTDPTHHHHHHHTIMEHQRDDINLTNNELPIDSLNDIIQTRSQSSQTPIIPNVTYVNSPNGLFPAPIGKAAKFGNISKVKTKYRFLGKFMAKAVMDSRMLDLPFSIPFYRWLLGEEYSLSLNDLVCVVPEVQSTLLRLQDVVRQRDLIQSDQNLDVMEKTEKIEALDLDGCLISDLELDFVLPGHAEIELRRGGCDTPVTIHNLHQYISLVAHWFLVEGVYRQFEAIREGFETVFSSQKLKMFYPEELENVFCGSGVLKTNRWDIKMLQDNCRTDHGFTQDSKAIEFFYDILSSYDRDEQRMFLQFLTGTPRLPTGGFKSLSPPLTIVRKTMDLNQNPDDYLPSVMTCVNYLKLPEYSTRDVMEKKLKVAANEGSMSFHLS